MKRAAASHAVAEVESGMVLGLGSGSTAAMAVALLAERIAGGLRVVGIPTSERTAMLAHKLGVPLTGFAEHRHVDLTIDGADQVERGTLSLIKGGGGALLREKIVAAASTRMLAIVDTTKLVDRLGGFPLPVEIVQFGWESVFDRIAALGLNPRLRLAGDKPFVTDGGNLIADCAIAAIADPKALAAELSSLVGVVETGLFIGLAAEVIIGGPNGIEILKRA